jgi:predicted nucleotidyltransferase
MYTEKDFETVKDIVIQDVPEAVGVILFGSYAKGKADEDSDMDIMILLENEYEWRERRTVLNRIYQDTARIGYLIDFLLETKQNFDHNKNLPTISGEIAKEGKVLWMKS